MKTRILITILSISFGLFSCAEEEPSLTAYDEEVIEYFKDVALGFEFGGASEITRKWAFDMKIFVGGNPDQFLLDELYDVVDELNALVSDGFQISVVSDTATSNFYIFLGPGDTYGEIFPSSKPLVASNWGLFSVFWNSSDALTTGYMYVDTERADAAGQRHLLREELTQSLGLAKDSPKYPTRIFQPQWSTTSSFAEIIAELIKLL